MLRRTLVILRSLASFQDIKTPLKKLPALDSKMLFLLLKVGSAPQEPLWEFLGVAGRLRELEQGRSAGPRWQEPHPGPWAPGSEPSCLLPAASQDRRAPPVAHHHSSVTRSSTGWRWGLAWGWGGAGVEADRISHLTSGSWSETAGNEHVGKFPGRQVLFLCLVSSEPVEDPGERSVLAYKSVWSTRRWEKEDPLHVLEGERWR